MASRISYHPGGYQPLAPTKNVAELWDGQAGTYTRWDPSGAQLEQRALTSAEAAELAAVDTQNAADSNAATLRQQASQALAANRTYIGLATPTAAQTTAQAKALSRQMNALIRLALGQLDGTD